MRRGPTTTALDASAPVMLGFGTTHVVNKTHSGRGGVVEMIRTGQATSLCTVRWRPQEALASLVDTFGFDLPKAVSLMVEWFEFYEQIAAHSLIVGLTEIENDPVRGAFRIGRAVAPDYDEAEALAVAGRYSKSRVRELGRTIRTGEVTSVDLGFSKFDPVTYFHGNHVPDRTGRRPSAELAEAARTAFAPWVDSAGRLK